MLGLGLLMVLVIVVVVVVVVAVRFGKENAETETAAFARLGVTKGDGLILPHPNMEVEALPLFTFT